MKLLIVESPAKAKTIEKYLDNAYKVKASVGHIRDLPKSNKNAIDIENNFTPHYETSAGKEKVVSELKKLAKEAEEVVLATDPDREGEAIAWHIKEAIGLKNPKRIIFNEITEEAVKEAISHPRKIDDNLRYAQEARRVLDRLFGYDLSGLIWQKLRYGLSAGRVQSPALRILVEREREIKAFKPEKYWIIEADLDTKKKETIKFTCSQQPKKEEEVEEILKQGQKANWQIKEVKETEVNRRARAPFTTSTLQQAASSRLGLSPSNTMRLAQKLYEAGHITYMRTDSTNLSASAQKGIKSVIEKKFGDQYYQSQVYSKKSKNAQEAHEAVRPSNLNKEVAGSNEQEKKLYRLIWQRTVASQMIPAKAMQTKITAEAIDKDIPVFTASGRRVMMPGWLLADPHSRSEDVEVPQVKQGDKLTLIDIKSIAKETEPPHRYTEAGLVKELEKRGIGRPSTYAPIIKTIVDRGYVEKEGKTLFPTETGEVVSEFLENHFTDYISDSFTAQMEDKLDLIAEGKETYTNTLKDFYGPFTDTIKSKKDMEKISNLGKAPDGIVCPVCGSGMVRKLSKTGTFYSCERFPDCNGALTLEGKELAGPKETGESCPQCKKGQLIEREGRFGKFISCNQYPKCKYIKEGDPKDAPGNTGVECPVCHKGTMMEKRGRFGIFYGCSNYPECKHIIKSKPTGKTCGYPRENGPCPHLMMEGTKTIPDRCSDKTCPNHNPHKLDK